MSAVIMKASLFFWLTILQSSVTIQAFYSYSLFEEESLDLCQSNTCSGRSHTICGEEINMSENQSCDHVRLIAINPLEIKLILLSHNSLRDRIARSPKKPAANMNYLQWDSDLARMAELWVRRCQFWDFDSCDYIYNSSFTVSHIFGLSELSNSWHYGMVRQWFFNQKEINLTSIDKLEMGDANYFTQMIWARTKFIGCSAVILNDINKIYMACYYSPRGNVKDEPIYITGPPCTKCEGEPTCSLVFPSLCGHDDPLAGPRSHSGTCLNSQIFILISATIIRIISFN